MIRKGQMQGVTKGDVRGQVTLVAKLFGVAAYPQQPETRLSLFSFPSISCNTTFRFACLHHRFEKAGTCIRTIGFELL